jgi:hypothetical protein
LINSEEQRMLRKRARDAAVLGSLGGGHSDDLTPPYSPQYFGLLSPSSMSPPTHVTKLGAMGSHHRHLATCVASNRMLFEGQPVHTSGGFCWTRNGDAMQNVDRVAAKLAHALLVGCQLRNTLTIWLSILSNTLHCKIANTWSLFQNNIITSAVGLLILMNPRNTPTSQGLSDDLSIREEKNPLCLCILLAFT